MGLRVKDLIVGEMVIQRHHNRIRDQVLLGLLTCRVERVPCFSRDSTEEKPPSSWTAVQVKDLSKSSKVMGPRTEEDRPVTRCLAIDLDLKMSRIKSAEIKIDYPGSVSSSIESSLSSLRFSGVQLDRLSQWTETPDR